MMRWTPAAASLSAVRGTGPKTRTAHFIIIFSRKKIPIRIFVLDPDPYPEMESLQDSENPDPDPDHVKYPKSVNILSLKAFTADFQRTFFFAPRIFKIVPELGTRISP